MKNFVINTIGKWLGIDLEYYIKNNAYLLIAQGVILLSGLATSVVLTRLLSKEDYGQYNYFFSIIGILAISALPGMGAAIMQAVANGRDQVFIKGTKTRFKWSLIGAAVCLLIGIYYYSSGETLLGKCFLLSSLFFPFHVSFDSYYPFLNGRQQFDLSSRYRSIYWVFLTLAVILAVYFTRNLLWVVAAYLATSTILHIVFLFNTVKTGNLSCREDKTAITYGKQLTGIQAISIAVLHFDKLIIGVALGYAGLAIYSIAVMIANLPTVLLASISQTVFPKTATMDEKVAYDEVKRRLPWLLVGMVIICGIGALLCPYIIPWLYSSKYLDSVLYTQLLFIPVILGTLATVLRRGALQAQRKTRELFKLNVAVAIFELVLLVLFAVQFGILGIVAAKALARAFDSAYSWKLTR
ncbi:MAG: oligosaccharide flippase family protein [Chloroflexota bacterium]|nr:oligosaccharide flippase family protein [Chloroflexota bacterium]